MNLMWGIGVHLIELVEFVWGYNILHQDPQIFLIPVSFPFHEELEVAPHELAV